MSKLCDAVDLSFLGGEEGLETGLPLIELFKLLLVVLSLLYLWKLQLFNLTPHLYCVIDRLNIHHLPFYPQAHSLVRVHQLRWLYKQLLWRVFNELPSFQVFLWPQLSIDSWKGHISQTAYHLLNMSLNLPLHTCILNHEVALKSRLKKKNCILLWVASYNSLTDSILEITSMNPVSCSNNPRDNFTKLRI